MIPEIKTTEPEVRSQEWHIIYTVHRPGETPQEAAIRENNLKLFEQGKFSQPSLAQLSVR